MACLPKRHRPVQADVDFVQTLSEYLDFLREALKLCPVNHVRQTAELVGVEEAPAVQGCADETLRVPPLKLGLYVQAEDGAYRVFHLR